ncbi:hypothetical protein LTR17_027260 [Elasticomyces elasticus]|nr:hypothetical protein LTR17_027260 [Elasticomyces elasticus]
MAEVHSSHSHGPHFRQQCPVTITARDEGIGDDVRPNAGATLPDVQAIGDDSELLFSWQQQNGIDPADQIKLVKLAHMRYQHPDLDKITIFLQDFGMRVAKRTDDEVWYRGYGADPYVYYARKGEKQYLGGTFLVESMGELERASHLPCAGPVVKMSDAPGGGSLLTLTDPEGFPVNLMYGQLPAKAGPLPQKVILNDESEKPRVRQFNRLTPGPAAVHKLGHFGLCVQAFGMQLKWYTMTFNFAPTDFLYVPTEGNERQLVATFMHIDRGNEAVDHHTFFMTKNPTSHVHHASFEVHDYDTQHLGHQWLAKRGYTGVWWIGRHILGSQIFDYWWDVHGNMIEHYTDGDLVTKNTPIGYGPAGDASLAVWGPDVPRSFLE